MIGGGFPTPEAKARERVISTYVVVDKARQRIFTPIFKRILVTYCHGSKSDLQPGQEIEVWANDSDGDMQQLVKARVLGLYPRSQILLCSTAKPINAPNLDISVRAGEPYIMLGCSNRSQKDPFSISHGCISTTTPDANGFIRGDTAPVPGDSGGGCFSAETGKLVAINVAADTRNGNRAVLVPVSAMISILVDHHQKDVQDLMPDFMEGDGEDQFT
ncbi:hypothetical protein VOLCADRAFT_88419 [Volvox carteri f. nagariensis]|uniref:Uncharacterized protein n=1 Tax=Volvox carteri f. nagariensis TaxID=3068 RepID=D8TNA8_VOLCA|nr:uncharacterized protein VOLCADRAFT_88419 [Volvox carteri f. nagariensis]EFJ51108.1 hypothetical protein VOLCADRAFT_88419 [Volvox carteri f. nagariensis]|eukprot:XP_002948120.1 hypothetical protein VOLCADRAFT_88419 [Volvox carteri f. nagariensis]